MTAQTSHNGTSPKPMQVKFFATIFGVFLLVMGLIVLAFSLAFYYVANQADEQVVRFERDGRDASALVVRKWKQTGTGNTTGSGTSRRTSSGSITYLLAVNYASSQGSSRDSVAVVNSASLWSATKEGDRLAIRYLDALPEWVMLKNDDPSEPMDAEEWVILFGSSATFLLMAAACFWIRRRFGHVTLKQNQRSR